MNSLIKSLIIFLLIIFIFSNYRNVLAQDSYKSVKIGNQIWMMENLNVDKFRNGDIIPEAKTSGEWNEANWGSKPVWCYFSNDPENGKKYGKFYNWFAVNDKRGLAPKGWHIPTDSEIGKLATTVNRSSNALKAIGEGTGEGAGTNTSGFSAMFAGNRVFLHDFLGLGEMTNFWCSTVDEYAADSTEAQNLFLQSTSNKMLLITADKSNGFSVRCIKD